MALTQVTLNNISTKSYAKQMVNEFLNLMQQAQDNNLEFTGACSVDPCDGSTVQATATQLRNVIKEQELEETLKVRIEKETIYLIDASLV